LIAMSMPSSNRPMRSFWYSTLILPSYRALMPANLDSSAPAKYLGMIWLRRAWNLSSKFVKQAEGLLEDFSSCGFNLGSPLSKCAHIEYEFSQFAIVYVSRVTSIG
jgi:hypothetical protein